MTDRALSRLAWVSFGLALILPASAMALVSLGWSTPLPAGWISWRGQVISCAAVIGASVLGCFVATRRPRNPYGWLWISLGWALSLLLFAQAYAAYALVAQPGALPFPRTMGTAVAGVGWMVWLILTPLLMVLFPSGRTPSPRWRFLVWTVLVLGGLALIAGPFIPGRSGFVPIENPLGVGGVAGRVIAILGHGGALVVLAAIPAAALSLIFRFRRAGGVERQQIKWFAYAAVVLVLLYLTQFFYDPPGAWDAVVEVLPLLCLYASIGVAILRHRLYDVDALINRTLVYGALTASLALVYFGSVATLQYALRALTGGSSQVVVVASTLAIAALFSPLKRGIQAFIDGLFYRKKYDARKTLESFGARLREETDLERLGEDLVGVVQETMRPAHARLWLRPMARGRGEER
ncbi:hypothetical protein GBA63_15260 [Rubrobacter tropicus]|uniref:Histidine kinase N-terminal 7TM region domain-containing protein n=1 Tax=Rubrobacter tropicus TaxID=2653851 RepID=A0A6G8QBG9_9ACTN|nr:hypothetical protein [Rubrobacter tropicus]QIN83844.1 hypothetical protein GBA63_15260 [Rubrobacter tropicus]